LKALCKKHRGRQYKGRAVHADGDAPFEYLGGNDVGLLAEADGRERRKGSVLDILLDITRFEYGIHVEVGDAVFDLFHHFGIGYAFQIHQAQVRLRLAADFHLLRAQGPVSDLAPDEGGVGAKVLRKAFPGAADHGFGLGLGDAALLPALCADDKPAFAALQKQDGVTRQACRGQLGDFRDLPRVGRAQHLPFDGVQEGRRLREAAVLWAPVHQGADHRIGQKMRIHQAVDIDRGPRKAVARPEAQGMRLDVVPMAQGRFQAFEPVRVRGERRLRGRRFLRLQVAPGRGRRLHAPPRVRGFA